MKKLLLAAIVSLCLSNVYGQTHEVSFSYSPLSAYQLEKIVDGKVPGQTKYFVLGALHVDYYRYLNDWLKIGVNVMYDRAYAEGSVYSYGYGYGYSNSIKGDDYSSSKSMFIVAPQVDFEYLRNPNFKLSSGIAIGYGIERVDNGASYSGEVVTNGIPLHLNLVGFRWGRKSGLTGNLGIGYKGLISLGYFLRF